MQKQNELYHYGVGHKDGGHSGRYPWGSGDRPKQSSGKRTIKKKIKEAGGGFVGSKAHKTIAKTALDISNKLGPLSPNNINKAFNKKSSKVVGGGLDNSAKQYKKDYKTTSKTVNKLSKKGGLSKDFTNRDAVYKKMNDEVFNKQAVKDYLEFDKQVADYIKKTAREKGIREDQVLITQKDPIGAELSKRMNEAKKAGEEVCDKYLDSYAKALLSDISYEDSAGARAAVRDMLLKTGFRNMLWG